MPLRSTPRRPIADRADAGSILTRIRQYRRFDSIAGRIVVMPSMIRGPPMRGLSSHEIPSDAAAAVQAATADAQAHSEPRRPRGFAGEVRFAPRYASLIC